MYFPSECSSGVVSVGVFRLIFGYGVYQGNRGCAGLEIVETALGLSEASSGAVLLVYHKFVLASAVKGHSVFLFDPCKGKNVGYAIRMVPNWTVSGEIADEIGAGNARIAMDLQAWIAPSEGCERVVRLIVF